MKQVLFARAQKIVIRKSILFMAYTSQRRIYFLIHEALGLIRSTEQDSCTFVSLTIGDSKV